MDSSTPQHLTLLLLGRTGNGKSSIGNSILGKKAFTPKGSSTAPTVEILREEAVINDHQVTVVDGPGIGDASFDNPEDIQATLAQVDEAFSLCSSGVSALLIVLKYGIRFTQQEKDAITMMKAIFGPDVVRNYGVIVMSHGDSFELDTEDEETSFEDWCKEQTGDVKALFTECDNRCVLFNNRTKEPEQLAAQKESLMSKVASVHSTKGNYEAKDFEKAANGRKQLIIGSKLPQLKDKCSRFIDDVSQSLDQLRGSNGSLSSAAENKMEDLEKRVLSFMDDLSKEDEGTGLVNQLLTEVKVTLMRIQASLKTLQMSKRNPEPALGRREGRNVPEPTPGQGETRRNQVPQATWRSVFSLPFLALPFFWRLLMSVIGWIKSNLKNLQTPKRAPVPRLGRREGRNVQIQPNISWWGWVKSFPSVLFLYFLDLAKNVWYGNGNDKKKSS